MTSPPYDPHPYEQPNHPNGPFSPWHVTSSEHVW
jgi:hypothetical protein